ncbi:MAG TPA: prolipoprotein diacylglyceryl transferase [Gammaproteobacteria bacterium]|nr:prolipoprotein diacylglyceryl transferase [Gammaproteobacteria bacterium]
MLAFPNIDPVAVHLGPLAIRWYGLAYVAGFLAAWTLLNQRAARPGSGWDAEQVSDLVFYSALAVVLGGRLGYVLFYNLPVYLAHPLDIFKVWQGGMSFHGGLAASLLVLAAFGHFTGRGFRAVADFLAPVVPIGLCLGRIANFINGELWGAPTDLPWGVVFPNPDAGGIPRHPSQLYEAGLEGVLLFVVLWWYSQRPRPTGAVAGLFLLGYGTLRFLVEFVRQPDAQLGYLAWDWLTMGQLLSLPVILFGVWMLWTANRRS